MANTVSLLARRNSDPHTPQIDRAAEHLPSRARCPGCGTRAWRRILRVPEVPVNCSALWPSKYLARGCTTGAIELRACSFCRLVFNASYDASKITYDEQYENSLDFSTAFQKYLCELAERLIEANHLRHKRIVEIGCGSGAFLRLLAAKGSNTGMGYDRSFTGDNSPTPAVSIFKQYFQPPETDDFDFLCCRHVLEHVENPLEFLLGISRTTGVRQGAVAYFEVPNGDFVLGGNGLWDVIYPHVSYFTETALRSLFERAGFEVLKTKTAFSNQFLSIEARLAPRPENGRNNRLHGGNADLNDQITSFTRHFDRAISSWDAYIDRILATRKRVAFWGAGAKG